MFEFLFSFLVATDTYGKIKKKKDEREAREILKKKSEESQSFSKYLDENFTDTVLEHTIEVPTDKEMKELAKKLPSYDKTQEWNISTRDNKYYEIEKLKIRLALADFGKMPVSDTFIYDRYAITSNEGVQWGRDIYDYPGQIKHELMLEWENRLRRQGFPYRLCVFNMYENSLCHFTINNPDIVKLASEAKYMSGNLYFWDYEKKYS